MVLSLTFRTDDDTRWGGGQGSNLSATEIDINFWNLFTALEALEDHQDVAAGIDFINQPAGGDQFFVHLTDHRVLGPFVIPAAQWNPRGEWQPLTGYNAFDVVQSNGQLYLVAVPHTSASTFSAFATDGLGHNLYVLILSSPNNALPVGGTIGQRLVKGADSPDFSTEWASDFIRIACFVGGQPSPSELLLQYVVTDHIIIPAGLAGSGIAQNTAPAANTVYSISLNGSPLGNITFTGPSPNDIDVSFSADVVCIPGDVLTLVAPATPDSQQADITIIIVAALTA